MPNRPVQFLPHHCPVMNHAEMLNTVLGRTSNVRLLRALLAAEEPITGREAARRAEVSQHPAHRSLKDLVEIGIVRRDIGPNDHRFSLNRDHHLVREGIIPLFSAETGCLERARSEIRERLAPLVAGSLPDVRHASLVETLAGERASLCLFTIVRSQDSAARTWNALGGLMEDLERRYGLEIAFDPMVAADARRRELAGSRQIERAREARVLAGRPLGEILAAEAESEAAAPSAAENVVRTWKPRILMGHS